MEYFRIAKTLNILQEHFYKPNMRKDVDKVCEICIAYRQEKSRSLPHELYAHLLISSAPWTNISMDFILNLSRSRRESDNVFVVVDIFSKMAHFIMCHKIDDTTNIVKLFFKDVIRLYGVSNIIVSNRDVEFLSHFWCILWNKLRTKLLFSTVCHP